MNLINKTLLTSTLLLTCGCQNINLERYETIFLAKSDQEILLEVAQEAYCLETGSYCTEDTLLNFQYVVDENEQIYLYENGMKNLYIYKNEALVNVLNLEKFSEKLMGVRMGSRLFIDNLNNFILIQLMANQNTAANYVYAKYNMDTGSFSEFKGKEYIFESYITEHSLQGTYTDNPYIKTSDGSVKTYNLEGLPASSLVINIINDHIYYLIYTGDSPHIVKATDSLETIATIEVPIPYKTTYSEDKEESTILWDEIYISDTEEVYISFHDTINHLWYIQKFTFDETPHTEQDENSWKTYNDANLSFQYPSILTLVEEEIEKLTLSHGTQDTHSDPCNLREATLLDTFIDFELSMELTGLSLEDTARREFTMFDSYIKDGTLEPSDDGWIMPFEMGSLQGLSIPVSSEYCGGIYYLIEISEQQTLLMYRKLITEWETASEKYSSNPDVITQNEEALYFEQIVKSLKVK